MLYDWLKEISFARPWMFPLFGLAGLLAWWYLKNDNRQHAAIRVSTSHAFTVLSWKNRLRHLPFIFRLLALSCLVLALAKPQKRNDREQTVGEGIDIVLCMDVSGSMSSPDISPSRLEVAKEMAEEFIRNRQIDRIGLVIFSGESFTQSPITTDKGTLITQIRSLESRSYLADGTVIGEGLATAVDRLSQSEAKSKVIVLLTDGKEDPPETRLIDPLTALEIAKSKGVKVYTIGMSAAPSATPAPGDQGPPERNRAVTFLDEELLRRIATETGGRYFRARDKEGLKSIYEQIDRLEKSKMEVTSFKRYEERFMPFILAALVVLFAEIILRLTILRKFP